MPSLYLIRHGESDANVKGVLAGRTPGVGLTARGRDQALALRELLHDTRIDRVVSSPLERCRQTSDGVFPGVTPEIVEDLNEVDYGHWTDRALGELSKEPAWETVQRHPSAMVFPGGEGLADMAHRAVAAVRRLDSEVGAEANDSSAWAAVTHGDVIKAILADALGMHLDSFQRLAVAPASLNVIHYGPGGTLVQALGVTPGRIPGAPVRASVGGGNEGPATGVRRPRH